MKVLGPHGNTVSKKTNTIFLFCLTCLLGACSLFQDDSISSEPVARVFDTYLYKEDIQDVIAIATRPEDSVKFVKRYLESWVKQQLILNKARLNLSAQQTFDNIEKQIEDYRTSLIIYAYQQELIKQKLDTVVSDQEIAEYYRDNANNLILRDDIIRARYMKIPLGAPDLDRAKDWCASHLEEDLSSLKDYCHQYASSFLLKDEEWVLFENMQLGIRDADNYRRRTFSTGNLGRSAGFIGCLPGVCIGPY